MWVAQTSLPLAHAVGPAGGVELELLLVGGALVVTSVLVRTPEGETSRLPVVLLAAGVAFGIGAVALPRLGQQTASTSEAISTSAIVLGILQPSDGDTVPANQRTRLKLDLQNAPLARSAFSKAGGHLHVYVDGKLQRMPYSLTTWVKLDPGSHDLTVEYVDSRHAAFDPPVQETVTVVAEQE
ncbi:MAG: hypothetical protein ABR505_09365 [Actinomycetota bacterium]